MTVIGVDIGQVTDYTAIVLLKPRFVDEGMLLDCPWIERLPLNTPYKNIITKVQAHQDQAGQCTIVIDQTGVGRPVVEQAKGRIVGARVIGLTITGGHAVNGWNVPKQHLISNLQIMMQGRRIRFAPRLPYLPAMQAELKSYRVKIQENARKTYSPHREGQHDDLVLALAIAAWGCIRTWPALRFVGVASE